VLARSRQYRMGEIGLCSVVAGRELAFWCGPRAVQPRKTAKPWEMFLAPLHTFSPLMSAAALRAYWRPALAERERRGTPIGSSRPMILRPMALQPAGPPPDHQQTAEFCPAFPACLHLKNFGFLSIGQWLEDGSH